MTRSVPCWLLVSLAVLFLGGQRAAAQTLTLTPSSGSDTYGPPGMQQTMYWVKAIGTLKDVNHTGYTSYNITVTITRTTPGQPAWGGTSTFQGPAGAGGVINVSYDTGKVQVPQPPAGGDTYKIEVTAKLYKQMQVILVPGVTKNITVSP